MTEFDVIIMSYFCECIGKIQILIIFSLKAENTQIVRLTHNL